MGFVCIYFGSAISAFPFFHWIKYGARGSPCNDKPSAGLFPSRSATVNYADVNKSSQTGAAAAEGFDSERQLSRASLTPKVSRARTAPPSPASQVFGATYDAVIRKNRVEDFWWLRARLTAIVMHGGISARRPILSRNCDRQRRRHPVIHYCLSEWYRMRSAIFVFSVSREVSLTWGA